MNILIINPNTSADFTNRIDIITKQYACPGTLITTVNPEHGPRSIEGVHDIMLSGPGILDIFLAHQNQCDAVVIASYGDHPMIYALRELTEKPIIGIAEASMHLACHLGNRFSIITSGARWEPLLVGAVNKYGLSSRCASIRSINLPVWALEADSEFDTVDEVIKQARIAVKEDGADVICLGSGGMAEIHQVVEEKVGVPVVNGVVAGLKIAESIVKMGLFTSKQSMYASPQPKPFQESF